jgi:hypothetical protein
MSTMMIIRTVLEIVAMNGKNSLTALFGGKVSQDRIRALVKVAALVGSVIAGVALLRLAMHFGPAAAQTGARLFGSAIANLCILPMLIFAVFIDGARRATT